MFQPEYRAATLRFFTRSLIPTWRRACVLALPVVRSALVAVTARSARTIHVLGSSLVATSMAVLLMLLASWFNPAHAGVSACGTIRDTVEAGQRKPITFNINVNGTACSPFGWSSVLTQPLYGTIEGNNASGARDG